MYFAPRPHRSDLNLHNTIVAATLRDTFLGVFLALPLVARGILAERRLAYLLN